MDTLRTQQYRDISSDLNTNRIKILTMVGVPSLPEKEKVFLVSVVNNINTINSRLNILIQLADKSQ